MRLLIKKLTMKTKIKSSKLKPYIIAIISLFLVFTGCGTKDYSIKIRYFNWGTTSATPITCDEIVTAVHFVNDTLFDSKDFYDLFLKEVEMLVPTVPNEHGNDFRIRCEFKNRDGQSVVLCSGESYDIVLNGEQMEDNERLFSFLKKTLYNEYIK